METAVSEKSTKAEILKAYETLLKDVQNAKTEIPGQVQEEKRKTETPDKVSGITEYADKATLKTHVENPNRVRNPVRVPGKGFPGSQGNRKCIHGAHVYFQTGKRR